MPLKLLLANKVITPDQIPDGHLVLQVMFNHHGDRYIVNVMGDSLTFCADEKTRQEAVYTLIAATMSNILALNGTTLEDVKERQSPVIDPNTLRPARGH